MKERPKGIKTEKEQVRMAERQPAFLGVMFPSHVYLHPLPASSITPLSHMGLPETNVHPQITICLTNHKGIGLITFWLVVWLVGWLAAETPIGLSQHREYPLPHKKQECQMFPAVFGFSLVSQYLPFVFQKIVCLLSCWFLGILLPLDLFVLCFSGDSSNLRYPPTNYHGRRSGGSWFRPLPFRLGPFPNCHYWTLFPPPLSGTYANGRYPCLLGR